MPRLSHAYTALKSLTEKLGVSAERAAALPKKHTQESNKNQTAGIRLFSVKSDYLSSMVIRITLSPIKSGFRDGSLGVRL